MSAARVILVHGAFHGAWCWDYLTPALAAQDVEAEALELPFTSLLDDADTVADAIKRTTGPVVAVGHSYGGAVITAGAGGGRGRPAAAQLVYLAALMLDPQDPIDLTATGGMGAVRAGEGISYLEPTEAAAAMYNRCSPEIAEWAVSKLRPMPLLGAGRATLPEDVAWRNVPSTYVVCSDDRAIDPDDQRRMAKQATRWLEIDADHSPFLSQVEQTAGIIADVARSAAD